MKKFLNDIYNPKSLIKAFKQDPAGVLFLIIPFFYAMPVLVVCAIVQYFTLGYIR